MEDYVELRVAMAKRQSESGFGRIRMNLKSRVALGLHPGDFAEITGRKMTVATVFEGDPEDEDKDLIRIDGLTRSNAGASMDEMVRVRRCQPSPAAKVVLVPNTDDMKWKKMDDRTEKVFVNNLIGRPLMKGMDIMVPNLALMGNRFTFHVHSTDPPGCILIHNGTDISVEDATQTYVGIPARTTYDDVGGLGNELKKIREMIELPLKHPELFERMGISAPKGVLMHGPPGTGKTLIAKAVAEESGASFHVIRGPEIMGRYYGQSEERLREVFGQAEDTAPSIIFLDEIDSIAPGRDSVQGETEKRVVAQLLTLMDGMDGRGNVIVIGATNRIDSIDEALRRPGRFDREIEIGMPGRNGRREILDIHTRNMPMNDDVDLDILAGSTHGFTGADLGALARESAMRCLSRNLHRFQPDCPVPWAVLETMKVSMMDFTEALSEIEPSGMREVSVDIPQVTWDDVGGLGHIKKIVDEIFLQTCDEGRFKKLGMTPGRSLLLCGPPGTGKTLMASAIANGYGSNFISVSGPGIANKWMGETESAIRKIFRRAKQVAPCVIFLDDLDSMAPMRGSGDSQAWERVSTQLLSEIDGIRQEDDVKIVAATNRPDILDRAMLRPGRFDRVIFVDRPNAESRMDILRIHTRNMPTEDVDLETLASDTEGYVGADLAALCREAGMEAYREDHDADRICMRHFESALITVRPSVNDSDMDVYRSMNRNSGKPRSGVSLYG